MTNKTKLIISIVLILVIIVIGFFFIRGNVNGNATKDSNTLKIGADIPLTGASSQYGESIRNGMELGKEELAKKGVNVDIYYEDSQADPKQGVNAYNNLILKNPNAIVSLYSRVSIPLIPLAERDKVPLIMTIMSAKFDKNNYTLRYYPDNYGYVDALFKGIRVGKYSNISILYLNDEYGTSVKDALEKDAKDKNINVLSEESFSPGTSDFKTQLTKIQNKNPDAIFIISSAPTEVTNCLRQIKELGIKSDFYDVGGVLSIKSVRDNAPSEGVYTTAFPSTLGITGNEFNKEYQQKYNKDPFYPAAFGYDIVNLIANASNRKSINGEDLINNIYALKTFDSSNGKVDIKSNGEMNPPLYPVKIVNGSLVEVK